MQKVFFKVKNLINILFKVFLALVPSKKLRAKLKADWTKFYIKKYVNIAIKTCMPPEHYQTESLPPVFQYWEQGADAMPDFVKICTNSINKFAPEFKHIILDLNSVENYAEIPSYILDLKKQGKITPAQFSDILRSALLAQRPAFWIDSTILLTGNIPNYIKNSDFFMFKGMQKTPESFACANYFFYSKHPNLFTKRLYEAVLQYWQDNDFLVSYFIHPHFISLLTKKDPAFLDSIPSYDEMLTLQFENILFKEYDKKTFENALNKSSIHKLTYKIPKNIKIENTCYAKIKELYGG